MPAVLFGLVVLSILATTSLSVASDSHRASLSLRHADLAYYTARAGMNQLLADWPAGELSALAPGDSVDLGWQDVSPRTRYRALVVRLDADGAPRIFAVKVQGVEAGLLGGEATLETVRVEFVPRERLFEYALESAQPPSDKGKWKKGVKLSDGTVDSYDSRRGAYGGWNRGSEGDIRANHPVEAKGKKTLIEGDVETVGGYRGSGDAVKGKRTQGGDAELTDLEIIPCHDSFSAAQDLPASDGYKYDEQKGTLTIRKGQTLELPSGTYSFHEVKLEDGAELSIAPGAVVEILIGKKLDMKKNAEISNPGGNPADLQLIGCGSGGRASARKKAGGGWKLRGGDESAFTIYAPSTKLKLQEGEFFGAFVGWEVEVKKASVHFDESLRDFEYRNGIRTIPLATIQVIR